MKPLDVLREEWRLLATKWAKAKDRAERYDEGRKMLLDQLTLKFCDDDPKLSVGKAEKLARTGEQFKNYLDLMYTAKYECSLAHIEAQNAERIYYERVGDEALSRAEMRLSGAGR
jgi:hypothetical protein